MAFNADYFLSKTLGKDFFESLAKFELWKPGTRTTVDHEEIKTALQIVPRTIMSHIVHHLTSMQVGETKETQIPIQESGAMLRVTKHERDVYSGDILQDNKVVVDFKFRSIPGVALVIMSAFELYDTSKLLETPENAPSEDVTKKVQQLIDERLALHDLIGKVVDRKIEERDAIKQLLMAKINETLPVKEEPMTSGEAIGQVIDEVSEATGEDVHVQINEQEYVVKSPLKGFLDNRKNKSKPAEFTFELVKGETVSCPDCGNSLLSGEAFTGFICLGDDRDKKVYIKKTENGVKMRFGRGWDAENIEMLLEVLRSKRG